LIAPSTLASALIMIKSVNGVMISPVWISSNSNTLLILVFGEITPKAIAARYNERVSQIVAPIIWGMCVVFKPIIVALDFFLNGLLKLLKLESQGQTVSEEEILHMVKTAEEEGSIKAIEKNLIRKVLEFDEIQTGEIITPFTDLIMISAEASVDGAIKEVAKEKHSRMPVYDGEKHNVVGVLYLRDLLGEESTHSVTKLMRKPFVVPESKRISDLMREFQSRKEHMALVVDEHGTITGVVTLEDVP